MTHGTSWIPIFIILRITLSTIVKVNYYTVSTLKYLSSIALKDMEFLVPKVQLVMRQ